MMPIAIVAPQPKTILIVDDIPANLGVMASYLEQLGFDVVTAQDGEEALQRAQLVQPDVILLDIMLPGMDGIETCRRMKAIASIQAIPVIFMTALTETSKKVEGFAAGGADYVTKPFQIDEVFARITTQLQLRTMHQQLALQNLALQNDIRERAHLDEQMRIAALVYQNSAEGMLVMDGANRTLSINAAFTSITGYALDDIAGTDSPLFRSHCHDPAFYAALWSALRMDGHWHGEVWNLRKNGEKYVQWMVINRLNNEDGSLYGHVTLFSDITEKKSAEALILRQANFDELTGLPNRRLFGERLAQEIALHHGAGLSLALLFIDLDRFKEINDTLGHAVGDRVLVEAGRRIRAGTRASDIVARLGGDEFIVVLTRIGSLDRVEQSARALLESLAEPFVLDDSVSRVSASIGISLHANAAPEGGQLLNHADQAMYVAKRLGGNRFSYFTPLLQQAAIDRRSLINDLRAAIDGKQFVLYFQAIVELASGRICKVEALLRWQHPQRGLLGPDEFIAVAEETGLITEIGDWVFREAVRWAKRWTALVCEPFQISINVSPVQFKSEGDAQEQAWLAYLEEMHFPATSVVLEITEGLLLDDNKKVKGKLRQYKQAGVQMAIDDFGTGYSSLSYLKKFDTDFLKIDRSFIRNLSTDPNDRVLSEAIIMMAHQLGIKVIAEGVETQEQRNFLLAAGCDYAQGYLFSKPLPPQAFEQLLLENALGPAKAALPTLPCASRMG
ncbi:MAG: EAL domain-containing protein [Massilia sp.]|nr:EAL domain-containing protein [Massilia sp.]